METPLHPSLVRRLASQFAITASCGGLGSALYWSAFSYLRVNRFVGFVRDPRPTPGEPAAHLDAVFERWTAQDIARWRTRRRGVPTQCFRDVVDGVSAAMVARIDGAPAALIWIYREGDPSRMFSLGPRDAELNHGIVLPEYRQRRLFAPLLSQACAWLATQDVRRVYATVHTENHPSLRAFRAAGFVEFARQTHVFLYRPKFSAPPVIPAPAATSRVA
jgi:RimJ/RimL family protein N-acetyltransferase